MSAWKRMEVFGGATLYLGDALEVMAELPKVDLVLTDPPYGMMRDGKPRSTSSHGGHKGYEFFGWDRERPDGKIFEAMLEAGHLQMIWGGQYFADLLPAQRCWLVWDKGQRIDQADAELAWTSLDMPVRVATFNRSELLRDGAEHPTQKPLALMSWCLGFLPKARIILDPFMGSGTTGVACMNLGRKFIGIEIEERYFDIACRRIDLAARQERLALGE